MGNFQSDAAGAAISEAILIAGVLAMGAFVLWLAVSELARRHRLAQLLAFRLKVLDQLSATDGDDVVRVVAELVRADERREAERGVRAAQVGVVSLATCVGLLGLSAANALGGADVWMVLAVLTGALGGGFLGAAWLARRWLN